MPAAVQFLKRRAQLPRTRLDRLKGMNRPLLLLALLVFSGCASVKNIVPWTREPEPEDPAAAAAAARLEARALVKPSPVGVAASTPASEPIRKSAMADKSLRV